MRPPFAIAEGGGSRGAAAAAARLGRSLGALAKANIIVPRRSRQRHARRLRAGTRARPEPSLTS
eukprot:4601135-Pyramimonas_sp.AAC.1